MIGILHIQYFLMSSIGDELTMTATRWDAGVSLGGTGLPEGGGVKPPLACI